MASSGRRGRDRRGVDRPRGTAWIASGRGLDRLSHGMRGNARRYLGHGGDEGTWPRSDMTTRRQRCPTARSGSWRPTRGCWTPGPEDLVGATTCWSSAAAWSAWPRRRCARGRASAGSRWWTASGWPPARPAAARGSSRPPCTTGPTRSAWSTSGMRAWRCGASWTANTTASSGSSGWTSSRPCPTSGRRPRGPARRPAQGVRSPTQPRGVAGARAGTRRLGPRRSAARVRSATRRRGPWRGGGAGAGAAPGAGARRRAAR